MTQTEFERAVAYIDQAFDALANAPGQGTAVAVNASLLDGKLYELRVLSWLLEQLPAALDVRVINGTHLRLKSKPGRVNRLEPHLGVFSQNELSFEIWNNVQFVGIGFERAGRPVPLEPDYHELDIALTEPNVPTGLLSNRAVVIAIECKDRDLNKGMLRQVLGLRRELSVMAEPRVRRQLRLAGRALIRTQYPPSRLLLCSSSPVRNNYDQVSRAHAIEIEHVAP